MKYIIICVAVLVICYDLGFLIAHALIKKKYNGKKRLRTVILSVALGTAITCIAAFAYMGIYYHCGEAAETDINAGNDVYIDSGNDTELNADSNATITEDGILAFGFTTGEFVDRYNEYYRADHGTDYLPSPEDPVSYEFREDEEAFSLPVLSVAATEGENHVKQITLSFDWHSYSEPLLKTYETMCFYAFKTVIPALPDKDLKALVDKAIDEGYENPADGDSEGITVFSEGAVAVRTRFATGERQYISLVPVKED